MIEVLMYTRSDCHLCRQVETDLAALRREFPHSLELIDIDSSPELQLKYGFDIPVVQIGVSLLKAPITRTDLRSALMFAGQVAAPTRSSYNTSQTWSRSDDLSLWMSKHYLAIINTLLALYVFLPFLAPVLMKAGAETPAYLIYRGFSMVCHQLSFRSFFLFGEQAVYPRAQAGLDGLRTFYQASGLPEGNDNAEMLAARVFTGSPDMGYKIALCERDIAIYGSILLFSLVFAATGRRFKPLPWYLWLLFGIIPIGLDGMSQLLSQPPLSLLPYRESLPELRVLTGALFGITTAWFGLPLIEQTMRDTREMLHEKKQRLQQSGEPLAKPEAGD